ncbi:MULTISPECIES: hypothetical protein [Pseudomonadota]|uniref:hypothetical protein n=1 Tax=Pseudomonadota TaxID=1224 RepID=UPI00262499B5|nr:MULTISPECIES: hypothetical protein [Pseudomonadota]
MTVTIYSSKDASAPALTGIAGSLVAVLDACLVNGYGTKMSVITGFDGLIFRLDDGLAA